MITNFHNVKKYCLMKMSNIIVVKRLILHLYDFDQSLIAFIPQYWNQNFEIIRWAGC